MIKPMNSPKENMADRILVASCDPAYTERTNLSDVDLGPLAQKFRGNKISMEKLLGFAKEIAASDQLKDIAVQADRDRVFRKSWVELLACVSALFKKYDAEYVLIKALVHIPSLMDDLDFLIPNMTSATKAFEALHEAGFDFFQFRLLAHR